MNRAKSGFRGAATRADKLLEKMELEYQAGDNDLKPNTFTYNAVINALAKSGEPGAAARAEGRACPAQKGRSKQPRRTETL